MTKTEQVIYIQGTYLIKEEILEDGSKKFYAKQVLDDELREELLYGRTSVLGPNKEPVSSLDDVKKLLLQ